MTGFTHSIRLASVGPAAPARAAPGGADQLGGLRQEVVERAGDVGEEIDQELERFCANSGEVRVWKSTARGR